VFLDARREVPFSTCSAVRALKCEGGSIEIAP
jgi:hypothetical protein